ncbi:ABC transporter substrate-binding protein [Enterovirga aerilata]|uniref:ABC transporter substrate-binding protein n=1 Tax=Enterovirga aerilata TaxID=2730920 RepID=A0A849IFA3_9HYPH|nr:ABC transporter substrate-binding protein [Enterovirga sp. DB1703]NNM72573.1 ABC transporter substrate-binding protein [Enterovirga sp. DB1703]
MSTLSNMSRALRLAAAGFLALGLVNGAASSAELTKLRVSTIPIADTASFEVARQKGFFAAEGLEIDTTPTSGGAVGIPALMSGQLQIAYSNVVSIVLAASQGLDLVIVAAADETGDAPPDLAGLVTKPGAGFKDGKALEGKRIAVNSRNNIIWLYTREWIAKTGGDPNKVNYIEVPFPQMTDAVLQGRVDAAMLVEPFLSGGLNSKQLETVGWPYSTVQKRLPVSQFATTRAYAEANPEILEKFRRALAKATDWTNANIQSDEFLGILSGYTKAPVERIKAATMPIFVTTVDPASVEFVASLMKRHGILRNEVDAAALIHPAVRVSRK